MKRIWVALLLAGMAFGMGSCTKEDIDDIRKELQEHDDRLTSLEEWQKSVNTSISSLQSLVEALENKDYVTGVTPLADGSGYEISFLKSGKITIKHGEKGEKGEAGNTPVISVEQDTDGKYYWTVNGEWLLDDGNKMPVTGEKGDDGKTPRIGDNGNWWIGSTDTGVKAQGNTGDNGLTPHVGDNGNWWVGTTDTGVKAQGEQGAPGASAIAPQVRINTETNEWEISTDGGKTWTSTGVTATGEKGTDGDSFFKNVDATTNEDYVVFTLANGTTFSLPKYKGTMLAFKQGETPLTDLTQTIDISKGDLTYTAPQGTTVSARMLEGENWKASVVADEQLISLLPGSLKEEALLEVTLTENAKVLETYRLTVMQSGLRGSGADEENPYLISSPAELTYIAETVNSGTTYHGEYFKLTQNIDLTGVEWTPIGLYNGNDLVDINFEGIFDGGGHTIKGLTIQDEETDMAQGFFGSVTEGEIKHLTLESPSVTGKYAGGIAGTIWNLTIVEDCHVKGGAFCAYGEGGSIVGLNDGSTIQNCSAESTTVTVEGAASGGGGIAGNMTSENTDANVIACRFSGNVRTNHEYGKIGGIVGGTNHGYCYIDACYANCILTVEDLGGKESKNRVGGVAATLCGHMKGCYAVVKVEGDDLAAVGGVVGYLVTEGYGTTKFDSSANACYWSAEGNNVSFGTGGKGFINNSTSDGANNETTIQVSGSDWSAAKEAMNTILSGSGWQYKENDSPDNAVFPLIVEQVQ